ncbi:MAG: hypothetical protein HOM68_14910 [Gemmatimonadetes bacterium]|jgi:hypothetical protein|nr:hypothetical protein [Gemmatimonadota bacterium]MBT4610014.1 hypothetical protein [Gemmatimonadota bacterium]MBT5057832.1 hypothetical protein [Gemmatimonadota bacterium]MBT5146374.1 hypothetical protein [Gemmatimonadota bacterium]MBT5591297.1 hypothetical protein [Gemmatimonadota bacterium]
MKAWIFLCNDSPLEHWLEGYKDRFDAWEAGGVTGLAVGRMQFLGDDGQSVRAYAPDPTIFTAHGEQAPEAAPRDPEKEKLLHAMLDDAAGRGWQILIFSGAGSSAHMQDLMAAFPQTSGVISDGPGEHSYELAFHHGGETLEINESIDARLSQAGADIDRVHRGIRHMHASLHNLTPERVRFFAGGGMLGGMQLLDINEDVLYWWRARWQASRQEWQRMREQVDGVDGDILLGGIPRTPAFSGLTGQDYTGLTKYYDLIFPKHYYWHRGMDGMYGTIFRWVKRLMIWNPTLMENDCFRVVELLTGVHIPGVDTLVDLEKGHTQAFFDEMVYTETRRALEGIGDPSKVIGWVSTGREPHGGDQMPPSVLKGILESAQAAGLQRFLYHPEPDIGAGEWLQISTMCGSVWPEDLKARGYWPGDTPRPDTWNGGRPVPEEE